MAEMIVAAVTPYNPMIESRMQSLHDQMTPEERAVNCPGAVLRDNYVDAPPLIGFPFTSSVYHVVKMIGRIIAVDCQRVTSLPWLNCPHRHLTV